MVNAWITHNRRRALIHLENNTIYVLDLDHGMELSIWQAPGSWIIRAVISMDDRLIALEDQDGILHVCALESGREVARFAEQRLSALAFSTHYIVAGNVPGSVYCLKLVEPGRHESK
jgi:hypothetical protein